LKSREVILWLDERWYQALTQQLEVEKLEDKLNEYLDNLISLLPTPVYDKIIAEMREEERQMEQAIAASQKYAAFRITENCVTEQFQMKQAAGMVEAAAFVRRWLRQAERCPFQEILPGRENIPVEEFDRMAFACVTGDQKITGVYDVDLDTKEFSAVRPELGWITYRLKDVSTASWHSYRGGSYDRERRQFRLMEKLADREIPSAGHLSSENIVLSDGLVADNGQLNFYMETAFGVDKVFGTRICPGESDDSLNIYANYDCAAGQVCDELEVDLHWADGREEAVEYRLNAVEKATLLRKMEEYCLQQTGQTLKDYSGQLLAEDMAPPTAPSM
jgi:hypothetical protein